MKTPETHFSIIQSEIAKGLENADFSRIMAASAALKRYREENRGISIKFAEDDCIVDVSGISMFLHKGDFYGKIVEINESSYMVEALGKRETMKKISELPQEELEIREIPQEMTVSVRL
jgi:hypothetical protein